MTPIFNVSNYFIEHAESLAVEIVEGVIDGIKLEISQQEKEQAIKMYTGLIGFLGQSLIENKEGVPQELIKWSKRNAKGQVSSGGKISRIVSRYPLTRKIFTEVVERISLDYQLSIKETIFIIKLVNSILDMSLKETVASFERLTDKMLEDKQKEMAELSAPIVPIKEGIAVLPLIGVIDSYRTTYILEKVVPKIAELQIKHIIVDFSGISTIDADIARCLFQIESILRLLGIHIIVTGLGPNLVRIIVREQIDMSSINTFAHVKQALESLTKQTCL